MGRAYLASRWPSTRTTREDTRSTNAAREDARPTGLVRGGRPAHWADAKQRVRKTQCRRVPSSAEKRPGTKRAKIKRRVLADTQIITTPRTRHPSHTGRTLSGHARRPKRPRGVRSACAARWKLRCRQDRNLPARKPAWLRVGIARARGSLSGFRRRRCGEGGSCGPGIDSLWRSGSSAALNHSLFY